jgi:dGTPase
MLAFRKRAADACMIRRLQYKTQVFVNHEGDYFRTRLTHSLEVAQIARSACRYLNLNEEMGECLALAHDLGHPPFGHAGEDALQETMEPFGGFDHNAQSLRVVTRLEERYAGFDGLNLTWETVEGIVKHNGPLTGAQSKGNDLPRAITEYPDYMDLELGTFAGPEAQIASLSDDIAYNNHDIEDGLRAGLFTIHDLNDVPLVGPVFARVRKENPNLDKNRLIHESIRSIIGEMVIDLLEETKGRLLDAAPKSADEIRSLDHPVAIFSDAMHENDKALKKFLFQNMYRHTKLNRMTSKARRVVKDLFQLFINEPECLPDEWRKKADAPESVITAQVVADYIAGMTDRHAVDEHKQLFDLQTRTS